MPDAHDLSRAAAETAARGSYGRLVAWLAARSRNIAAAEDALSEAFAQALATWPERGVPDQPDAWLLTAARRNHLKTVRHGAVVAAGEGTLQMLAEEAGETMPATIPDKRLQLMFVCAHPAIDEATRTPLMLQTVLGLDAARIASAFLIAPATMGQRLVRAKAKIRDAGIGFVLPEQADLPDRIDAVLEAIYAAYGTAWDDVAGADERRRGLAEEAIWLARVLVALLPDAAEPRGLLALMLHCEARRCARRDADGAFVALAEQDVALWDTARIAEAEAMLGSAAALRSVGRFQLEAAIQSLHASRARTGWTNWAAIALMYEGLVRLAPTMGTLVARAAALAEARGVEAGLAALDQCRTDRARDYQPFWALRAHLLARRGDPQAARDAYTRAIGLSEDPAVRTFLAQRRDRLAH